MDSEVLVKVEGVSKKFARSLKRSLWYGIQDIAAELWARKCRAQVLRKHEFWAVEDVSVEIRRGECLGLVGRNGAGKSTFLKMLNGLVKPDTGRITMRGRVGALIELGAGFNPILTARENIFVNGSVLGFSKREIDRKFDEIVDYAEIQDFIDTPVQNFSSGMKVRLGFAIAVQMEPDILLIDEILAVGDSGFRAKCFSTLSRLSNEAAVILVSHSMPDIARTASSVRVMDRGRSVYESGDVASGIDYYSKLFGKQEAYGSESSECKLISFTLRSYDSGQQSVTELSHLETVIFELEFLLNIGDRKSVININIEDVQKRAVAQCASIKSNFSVRGSSEIQKVVVTVSNLPLSLGRYSVSVYLVEKLGGNRRGEIFCFRHNVAEFYVFDETPGYVPIHLPAIWQSPTNETDPT